MRSDTGYKRLLQNISSLLEKAGWKVVSKTVVSQRRCDTNLYNINTRRTLWKKKPQLKKR